MDDNFYYKTITERIRYYKIIESNERTRHCCTRDLLGRGSGVNIFHTIPVGCIPKIKFKIAHR